MKLVSSRRVLLAGPLVVALAVTLMPAHALAYCSEPSTPYCASGYGRFDDEWEFRRCKSDMESYQSDVEEFIGCNNREAEEAAREAEEIAGKARNANETAISDFNDAVESFNQRAGQ